VDNYAEWTVKVDREHGELCQCLREGKWREAERLLASMQYNLKRLSGFLAAQKDI